MIEIKPSTVIDIRNEMSKYLFISQFMGISMCECDGVKTRKGEAYAAATIHIEKGNKSYQYIESLNECTCYGRMLKLVVWIGGGCG